MGVIARVHNAASHFRATAEPALAASLAEGLLIMVSIANFAYGGSAFCVDVTQLAGGHFERRAIVLNRYQLKTGSG